MHKHPFDNRERYSFQIIQGILSALLLLIFFSCKNGGSDQTTSQHDSIILQNDTKIHSNYKGISIQINPKSDRFYKLGDQLRISASIPDSFKADTIRLKVNDQEILLNSSKVEYVWNTKDFYVGRIPVSIEIMHKGKIYQNAVQVSLISDIIPETYKCKIINTFPHDKEAYTQGLLFLDAFLYESTGLTGKSTLRKVDLKTGEILQNFTQREDYFCEGLASYKNKLYQLTWRSQVGFVYDLKTFQIEKKFSYPTEGWGLAFMDTCFVMSDGSSTLYFIEPETFVEIKRIEVADDKLFVDKLNELEFINGEIWANIYTTDKIAKIDPKNGKVTAWINLSNLLKQEDITSETDVLNGIAYDAKLKKIYVTGKNWPKLFEISLVKEILQKPL